MTTAIPDKLMTADEFFDWAHLPENEDRSFELEDGRVVEMSRPGRYHGVVCAWIVHLLWKYIERAGQGHVLSNDTGLLVKKRPDTLRGPDIMFFRGSMSLDASSHSFVTEIPDLVVEVMSPTDRPGKTNRRIQQYLKRGIPLVWQVDPDDRLLTIHRPEELSKTLDDTDTVNGNGVLPGFKCPVAEFFKMPGVNPN